jgi:hypothetical protein
MNMTRRICLILTLAVALPVAMAAAENGGVVDLIDLLDASAVYAQSSVALEMVPSAPALSMGWQSTQPGFAAPMARLFRPVLMQRGEGRGRRERDDRRNERDGERDGNDQRRERPDWRGRPMPPPGMGRRGPAPPPPEWMDQLKNLPPEEQEKVLRNSERFQELPKERQEQLIQRLHRFQELPPDQKDMIMQRFGAFNRLSPEQRQKTRELLPRWRGLPQDRRDALQDEFRKMRGMTPDEREKYLSGREMDSRFSSDERDLLKQLNSLEPPFPPPPPRGGMPGPPPFPRDRRR